MRITYLCRILWLLAFAAANLYAAEEQDLIATLQSSASTPQQWAACQRLRIIGTAKAVPALAALLTDERASQAARHVLEGLPYPEAGVALRDALPKTSGLTKVGVIDSLGWRAESASVPVLAPLLSESDTTIAVAAAAALGRIGGQDAIVALSAACGQALAAVQPAVQESLLKCAERLAADGDRPGAAAVYRGLLDGKCLPQIRPGAWRGLALADSQHQADVVMKALTGADRPIRIAALKLLREVNDRHVIQACLDQWTSLTVDAQSAVLDSQAKLGAEARPTARLAAQSPNALLRTAAWETLGALNDADSIPALAKAAAHAEPAESQAAREALARLDGPGVKDALLSQITASAPPEKAELLRALGERGDRSVANVLLQNATSDVQPVRLAALGSLSKLAPPEAVLPLLDIAAGSKSDDDRDPVLKALYAVYAASPNQAEAARGIIDAMGRFPAAQRRQILPLLAEIADADALSAAQTASRDPDAALAKEAVRVLAQWPNAAPAAHLLELARAGSNPTLQVLALRGAINVAAHEPDSAKRLALLQQSLAASKRLDEKKQVLGQIGQIPTSDALNLALNCLTEAGLADEAGLAAVTIAEKLASSDAKLADEAATRILAQTKEGELAGRAWALRVKPTINVPFIRDWQFSGPYRQAGAVGAVAIFNIPFAPEDPGQNAEWKTMPPSDQPNLAALFPGQDNCAGYLRTRLVVSEDCHAALLTGSDDGLKAWLNGQVVQSKNVDRGEVVDQDAALIHLKPGTNELLLKISQGGGGWGACARIVGTDFKPVPGLQVDCPKGAPLATPSASSAAPETKPAELPKRDSFRRLRLSDQFYAEGANCADFNRDGKVDIVAGPFWFEGPDFQKRHEYRPTKAYDPKESSDNFLTFTGDFNGDGWTDILCVPFPGAEGYWYENPAGKDGPWKKHLAYSNIGNESPVWGDINGDGRPELVFCNDGYLGYAGPNSAKPEEPWVFHTISGKDQRFQRFTHGVGFGDINGDHRVDIIEAQGWWEQPADISSDRQWIFHPFQFADAGAQMIVYDVNGDGLPDVITAWHCHHYGLIWWQQVKGTDGQPDWKQHIILSPDPNVGATEFRVSQMHAMDLVDMNGDGMKDIVTGKRFWAHGPTGDKEPDAPAVLFWLELHRDGVGGASFVPHLIDDDSGVGTQVIAADLNGDGKPDIVVANKKGIFVHLNESTGVH